jgi:putative ABC transport system substrate-binding protein
LLGGAAATWPLAARAQQPERTRRIGVLVHGSQTGAIWQQRLAAFREGLEGLGWQEGRNIHIETLFSDKSYSGQQTLRTANSQDLARCSVHAKNS